MNKTYVESYIQCSVCKGHAESCEKCHGDGYVKIKVRKYKKKKSKD